MAAGVLSASRYVGGVIGVGMVSTFLSSPDVLAAHQRSTLVLVVSLVFATAAAAMSPCIAAVAPGEGAAKAIGDA